MGNCPLMNWQNDFRQKKWVIKHVVLTVNYKNMSIPLLCPTTCLQSTGDIKNTILPKFIMMVYFKNYMKIWEDTRDFSNILWPSSSMTLHPPLTDIMYTPVSSSKKIYMCVFNWPCDNSLLFLYYNQIMKGGTPTLIY